MNTLPVATFNYNIDALLEEVTKRTSYTGMMRGTEQEPYLVDRMSLTSGENFMFKEFLEEAVHETYDWVKAFGRNIHAYDKIVSEYEDVPIYKDYGVRMVGVDGNDMKVGETIKLDADFIQSPTSIQVTFDEIIFKNGVNDASAKVNVKWKLVVYSVLGGELNTVEILNATTNYDTKPSVPVSSIDFPFESQEATGDTHEIKKVELSVYAEPYPNTITNIKKGTYVEYRTDFGDDSIFDLYKVNADCTNADWMNHSSKLNYDPRGCVVYMLECKEHFDENMIPSVDRALKEAIINRIIYLWFEYVNAPEAEKYLLKFEEYGHKAQLGMNTRTKDIQRKYKLF